MENEKKQKKNDFLEFLEKKKIPIWFMRQAGRYLPEYMEIRKNQKDFLAMCYNPKISSLLTLQPIQRFDFDFAIIFSDILVVLDALGYNVKFLDRVGPVVEKKNSFLDLDHNVLKMKNSKLQTVYESISIVKKMLQENKQLIGFVGAPWTLACYAYYGKSLREFHEIKAFAYNNQQEFAHLIKVLTNSCLLHASKQLEAGADIIQIFDSWSGALNEEDYKKWVLEPLREVCISLKAKYPSKGIIWFPRGSMAHYGYILQESKKFFSEFIDCISIDHTTSIKWISDLLDEDVCIQGNLDPAILLSHNTVQIDKAVDSILGVFAKKKSRCVFNLGHGILPDTKIENVSRVIRRVRNFWHNG